MENKDDYLIFHYHQIEYKMDFWQNFKVEVEKMQHYLGDGESITR